MKKWFSVLELYAAMRMRRVLLVIGAMSVLTALAYFAFGHPGTTYSLFEIFSKMRYDRIFMLGYFAMFWALAAPFTRSDSYYYSLQRLKLSERSCALILFIFCALCFVLLILAQAALLLIMAKMFEIGKPFAGAPQGVLIDLTMDQLFFTLTSFTDRAVAAIRTGYILIASACAVHMSVLFVKKKVPVLSFAPAVLILLVNRILWDPLHILLYVSGALAFICLILAIRMCRGRGPLHDPSDLQEV